MPIYEYRRPDGSTFEIVQSFSDEALTRDPETGVKVQRVLHAPAVHFKGKGFYNTDYGTRNRQRETAAAAAASSPEGEKASTEKGSSDKGSSEKGSSEKSSSEKSGSEKSGSAGSSSSPSKSDNGAAKKSSGSAPVAAKS